MGRTGTAQTSCTPSTAPGVPPTKPTSLEPIDALVAEGLVDGDRLAITGYSYGGYSTCHLTSATDRFAAAVAGGLICDFNAMAGVCDFGPHLASLATGTTVPENSAKLLAASPLAAVKNVVTPTLILHGKSDERCPLGQAEAWFAALRQQHVPTRLVAYPGASHGFLVNGSISHRIDYSTRLIEWVKRYTLREAAQDRPGQRVSRSRCMEAFTRRTL